MVQIISEMYKGFQAAGQHLTNIFSGRVANSGRGGRAGCCREGDPWFRGVVFRPDCFLRESF